MLDIDNLHVKLTGENYETAYVPAEAGKVLKRFDARSQHFELRESRR